MKIIALLFVLILLTLPAQALTITAENSVTNSFMQEKISYFNQQDWQEYNNAQGNYYVIMDDQHYLIQVNRGKVIDIGEGVPPTWDYKIVTSQKNAEKWSEIAQYYVEHGEFKFRHRYWDIPILRLQTSIQQKGKVGNIAYIASAVTNSNINIT